MISDYLHLAIDSIGHRKLRSWLTIIGIIIGIASIIALVTISNGLENAIREQFEQMGSNRIYVSPKGFMGPGTSQEGLTTKDSDTIKRVSEVEWTTPYLFLSDEITYSREAEFVQQIVGMPADDMEKKFGETGLKVEEGRVFVKGEKGAAIIGYRFANDKYDKKVSVNSKIEIRGEKFRVVGILSEVGNSEDDNRVIIPEDDARRLYEKPKQVDFIEVKLKEGVDISFASGKIKTQLERARDDENFEVMTPEQILQQIGSLLGIVQIILGGIAAISLVVGAIGISNSMYTNVLERTKEIGIMKSIGAKNRDVMMAFLTEAALIGLIGGFFGIILGSLGAMITGAIAKQQGFGLLKITLDWKLMIFGMMFAMAVGMLSGLLPARQAAKMKPADSLRY